MLSTVVNTAHPPVIATAMPESPGTQDASFSKILQRSHVKQSAQLPPAHSDTATETLGDSDSALGEIEPPTQARESKRTKPLPSREGELFTATELDSRAPGLPVDKAEPKLSNTLIEEPLQELVHDAKPSSEASNLKPPIDPVPPLEGQKNGTTELHPVAMQQSHCGHAAKEPSVLDAQALPHAAGRPTTTSPVNMPIDSPANDRPAVVDADVTKEGTQDAGKNPAAGSFVATKSSSKEQLAFTNSADSRGPTNSKTEYSAPSGDATFPLRESAARTVVSRGTFAAEQNLLAIGASTAPLSPTARGVTAVKLPVDMSSPDFTRALGVQVSMLVSNGAQRAELELNPAEMGPISVRIAMAGTHARVDFSADLASTRQVIEDGLPELASALREQGFTLSGGGVYPQAQNRQEHADADTGATAKHASRNDGESTEASQPHQVVVTQQQGGVDLYA